jgi:hypothetical protein
MIIVFEFMIPLFFVGIVMSVIVYDNENGFFPRIPDYDNLDQFIVWIRFWHDDSIGVMHVEC